MSKLDAWVDNKFVQNLFIWFFLYLILLATIQGDSRGFTALYAILLIAPAVYVNNLLILPLLKKNVAVFVGLFIVNTVVFAATSVFIISVAEGQELTWTMYVNFVGIVLLALLFATTIRIARDSFMRRQQEKDAELKLLKAQLNPHFLFNTLNNLYGLSVIKSEKLPDLMLKLSDLLRYSLYETKETLVPLEKEIYYLENYISLEKIRLEDTTIIAFSTKGDLSSIQLAPMLFIVFVENAFKHLGTSKDAKSAVTVSIIAENNQLVFTCDNTIDPLAKTYEQLEEGKSGIGLQNVKKRLALIYPERHVLRFRESNTNYNVQVTLDL